MLNVGLRLKTGGQPAARLSWLKQLHARGVAITENLLKKKTKNKT